MLAALAELTELEREAVLLVAWDGLPNRDAAARRRLLAACLRSAAVRAPGPGLVPSRVHVDARSDDMTDILESLAELRPAPDSGVDRARQDAVLAAILDEAGRRPVGRDPAAFTAPRRAAGVGYRTAAALSR